MTAYSDRDIRRALATWGEDLSGNPAWLRIDPVDLDAIQPASVDLRLGSDFLRFPDWPQIVDLADRKVDMESVSVGKDASYRLEPGGFVLGTTIERVTLGPKIVGKVEGKSSLGRIGLTAHVTAGFIDPGFNGQITLELFNASPNTILLRPGVFICQIAFFETAIAAERPYGSEGLGSRYQNQDGVQAVKE